MKKDIHFCLERYKTNGTNRYTCPSCGRKKCFTRYINLDTGKYVDDDCGKCNHVSSCGYHYPPREYYRDHPEPNTQTSARNRHDSQHTDYPLHDEPQTTFYDISMVQKAKGRTSPFRTWFESLPFDHERIQQVLADYYVGATNTDTRVNGTNYGPAVIFWQIDEQQRVHDGKVMAYHPNGHRVEGWANTVRALCVKHHKGPQLDHTDKVLFGVHLITRYPDRIVCIVESEKTALICACRYPDYLWLATGGCGNLTSERLQPLMDRKLVIYPDSGEYTKWQQRMQESLHRHYHIIDYLETYPPNTDIADLILGEAQERDAPATTLLSDSSIPPSDPSLLSLDSSTPPFKPSTSQGKSQ